MKRTMTMLRSVAAAALLCGCADSSSSSGEPYVPPTDTPPDESSLERLIEESDLYKLEGSVLYLQNPDTGLNVVDVSVPDAPVLAASLGVTGEAGELYVRDDRVFVLFESQPGCTLSPAVEAQFPSSTRSEVVAVVTPTTDPKVAGRYCMPGTLVASRIVGEILYMVTSWESTSESRTLILSVDLSDAHAIDMVDYLYVTGEAREVHVTTEAIYMTRPAGASTEVVYVDISDPEGIIVERGSIVVTGQPRGRFHMHAQGDAFRIVTYSGLAAGTNLHVIDASDPDHLVRTGTLSGLAPGEELWATLFVEDRAYVVTYLRWVPDPEPRSRWLMGNDPLWVISLEDPGAPEVLGELIIPGWSNFLFERGDRLVAVGRGDMGQRVALALFDVSDPTRPDELDRLEFGPPASNSEANFDFRGISIVETLGETPLVAVPVSEYVPVGSACTAIHYLYLVDLHENGFDPRSVLQISGRVRRSFAVEDSLYALSDRTLSALDVTDRSRPDFQQRLVVGDLDAPEECVFNDFQIDYDRSRVISYFPFACSSSGAVPTTTSGLVLGLVVLAALVILRRRSPLP